MCTFKVSPNNFIFFTASAKLTEGNLADFTKRNLMVIQHKYASLLYHTSDKLQQLLSNTEKVALQLFIRSIFRPLGAAAYVPQTTDIPKLFEALTVNRQWDFCNYYALEQLIEEFGDQELNEKMMMYKKDYSGFMLATKIKHFILATESDQALAAEQPPPDYFRKLSIKLDMRVSEYSLQYIEKLWQSLSSQLSLPSPHCVLHSISKGCVCVTWLIPANLAQKSIEKAHQNIDFFRKYPILKITTSDECVYIRALTGKGSLVSFKSMPVFHYYSNSIFHRAGEGRNRKPSPPQAPYSLD